MKSLVKKSIVAFSLCIAFGLAATGCSPNQSAEAKDESKEPEAAAVSTTWSPDIDCAACHETEAATSKDVSCLAGTHTMEQEFTCMTCHIDDTALSSAHANMNSGKTPKKLKKTEVSQDLCLSCHDQNELAEATAASIILTDDYGKTVNPHAIPENEDHADDVLCTSCHKGHSTNGIEEDSKDLCAGCHHANVYECGTCHEE